MKIINKTNRNTATCTDVSNELDENNDIVQFERPVQGISGNGNSERKTDGTKKDTSKKTNESARSQDFFRENKDKIETKYTTTSIKSRNFLSNIAYVGINREDFYNENFIFDFCLLIRKKLNPFSLDRKLPDKNKHEMLYMLWKECKPPNFYQHIFKEKHFLYLNDKNILQPRVSKIKSDYLDENTENYNEMRNNLSHYKNIFQYVCSNIFPEFFCSMERRGFDLKSSFHIIFKI